MIKTFKQYIEEAASSTLHVFDIDDTLAHSPTTYVHVKDPSGKTVERLNTSEYNTHKLKPGHNYDFHEFKSSKVFQKAKPIHSMIRTINGAQATTKKNPNNRVIMNTARADFDDKDKFIGHLSNMGIENMDKIHVHRAGNIPGNEKPPEKKLVYIRQYLEKHPYSHVKMYDDSKENLNAFLKLRHEYPNTKFHAFHVGEGGKMQRHEPESVSENMIRDANGKLINNKKVAIRMANGKIEMQDPGKSGSSGGGGI
jgi:hypothetical protein